MPLIQRGALKGCYLPDYAGGSIINLLSSIIRSRGGRSPHRELAGLSANSLGTTQKVIYLLIDGLGEGQLRRFIAAGGGKAFLAVRKRRTITTVFPATTAAAVTTFASGASPAEHAVLGWHLHLPDLGLVSTILPATTKTGAPMAGEAFDLRRYLSLPSHLATTKCKRALLSWGAIPNSRFSKAGGSWNWRSAYTTLQGLEKQIAGFVRRPGRAVAYAYWPDYDTFCHGYGCDHAKTVRHLRQIDEALARIAHRLEGTNAMLIVTADHGLVDTPPKRCLELREVKGLYDCLAMIPSGDARQTQCFVRPAKVAKFLAIVRQLAPFCVCIPGEELLAMGVFGPGKPHSALANRVGDFVLLARDGCAIAATPTTMESRFNLASHGGMSPAEVLVPLYVVPPGRAAS